MRALESRVVVLVHPDDDNREMYATFLRQHGFAVLTFAGATDALGLAPLADIIVTGIQLRGAMDGVQLIARIRCDERTRHTPIIVVTASTPTRYKPYAEAAGCNRFLLLPCLPQDLLQEIDKLVPPRVASNTRVAKRPVRVDPAENQRHKRSA